MSCASIIPTQKSPPFRSLLFLEGRLQQHTWAGRLLLNSVVWDLYVLFFPFVFMIEVMSSQSGWLGRAVPRWAEDGEPSGTTAGFGRRQQGRMAGNPDSAQGAEGVALGGSGSPWPGYSFLLPLGPYPAFAVTAFCWRPSLNLYSRSGKPGSWCVLILGFQPSTLV